MKIEKRKDLTNLYKLFYQVTLVIATAEFRYFTNHVCYSKLLLKMKSAKCNTGNDNKM